MRVLVLGAGYAGVTLARKLESALPDDDVVVVDDTGEHLVQHEVHRVIRKPTIADHITLDLADLFDSADVREGTVVDVDPDGNEVRLDDGTVLDYDVAAVCLGSETAFYDLPGVREHAIPCKRIEHARQIREAALDALAEDGHVVVGGAGLSGVQVAGELAALRDERADADPDVVDVRTEGQATDGGAEPADSGSGKTPVDGLTISLVEMADSVAPAFPENFQTAVHETLLDHDVRVRTGATVERATENVVELDDGSELEYDAFVWTGGIQGPAATGGERVDARADLRVGDGTFVVGDAGRVVDGDGEAVPASAQSAIREARVAAKNVERLVEHRRSNDAGAFEPTLDRFNFDSPGWLVSIGNDAVAQVGPGGLTGRAAVALKASVGAGYLSGVGALQQATDLVNDELGLDPGDGD